MSDLIKREDAIKALYKYNFVTKEVIEREIMSIPSADTDLSGYSDKLWKNAYERGKTDRPRGEWKVRGNPKRNLWECSLCRCTIYSESESDRNEFHKWCGRCGTRMKGADDE